MLLLCVAVDVNCWFGGVLKRVGVSVCVCVFVLVCVAVFFVRARGACVRVRACVEV